MLNVRQMLQDQLYHLECDQLLLTVHSQCHTLAPQRQRLTVVSDSLCAGEPGLLFIYVFILVSVNSELLLLGGSVELNLLVSIAILPLYWKNNDTKLTGEVRVQRYNWWQLHHCSVCKKEGSLYIHTEVLKLGM